ncbi:hypothetical protein EON64_00850 [archaeon]|nr:MAG: hypothetical protein EON64_00850 [archaeon]
MRKVTLFSCFNAGFAWLFLSIAFLWGFVIGEVNEAESKPRVDDHPRVPTHKEEGSEASAVEGKPLSQKGEEDKKMCDSADVQFDLDQITIEDIVVEKVEEECGVCMICADNMLSSCDIALFVKDQVKEPERRALTCLSGHSFCVSCWSSHAQVQLSEHSSGGIPCPAYKCGEILDVQWAPILLKSQDLVNRLLTQRMRHIVDCAGFKHCPIDNCHVTVYVPEEGRLSSRSQSVPGTPASNTAMLAHNIPQAGVCSNGHMFCLSCSSPAHTPCSCSDYLQWQTLVQEELKSTSALAKDAGNNEEIANALWVAANTKRCPRCGTAIEKDEGCNHMSCRKCRKEFCWICMQDWTLHSDNTGGYFQCNRFVQQPTSSNNESGDMWSEERGNAHAEAMRARERSMKMARFIHHYTRYKAHSDSMVMELRMHKETLRRISDGFKACRDKKLLWLQPAVPNPLYKNEETTLGLDVEQNVEELLKKIATPSKFDPTVPPCNSNPVLKHCIQCDRSIQFLDDGFEELLKTRSVSIRSSLLIRKFLGILYRCLLNSFFNGRMRTLILSLWTLTTSTTQITGRRKINFPLQVYV